MVRKLFGAVIGAVILSTAGTANAVISHNQNVTPDIIFGSGNTNGNFTVDRSNGIELGLRAKIPFVGFTNSNGDGTFTYRVSQQELAPDNKCVPIGGCWNFEWTVNTDFEASDPDNPGRVINELTYLLGIDFDPGAGTDFLLFDPITPNAPNPAPLSVSFWDHSIGKNNTANGAGTEANDATEYATLIDENNVLQQSWRHAFFPFHPTLDYDPTAPGVYDIFLTAFDGSAEVAHTQIQVFIQAPEPGTLALFGAGLLGLGIAGYRRKTA